MAKGKAATGMSVVRYVGDGSTYVIGLPAEPGSEVVVSAEQAQSLIETGIYEFVGEAPAPPQSDGSGQEEVTQ